MAVNPCEEEEQTVYCISPSPDKGMFGLPCETKLSVPSFMDAQNPLNSQMCLDAELDCKSCINLQMLTADSSCTVDVDIETGNMASHKANDETTGSLVYEGAFTLLQRAASRQISLEFGGKLMQFLILLLNFITREKAAVESPHDTPNHRWRKYKRSTSFDSRKIALLLSALSSMGTMILIYLTLRVS